MGINPIRSEQVISKGDYSGQLIKSNIVDKGQNELTLFISTFNFFESINLFANLYSYSHGKQKTIISDLGDVVRNGFINLSFDILADGKEMLNIAFYDAQINAYFYYYGKFDGNNLSNYLGRESLDIYSEQVSEQKRSRLLLQAQWFLHANILVKANEESYIEDSLSNEKINYILKNGGSNKKSAKNVPENFFTKSLPQNDDSITSIIPRSFFTSAGAHVGYVGSVGYFINAVEWLPDSGRYVSSVMLWQQECLTPNYSSDSASLKTTVNFSDAYEYAANGNISTELEADCVKELYDSKRTTFALRNIESSITLLPTCSVINAQANINDFDEFMYDQYCTNNGYIFTSTPNSLTGFVFLLAKAATAVMNIVFKNSFPIISVVSGTLNTVVKIIETVVNQNNGIISSQIQPSDHSMLINFVADRQAHFSINNNSYLRNVSFTTNSNNFFSTSHHTGFSSNSFSQIVSHLQRTGTPTSTNKKLVFVNNVQIVDFYLYNNQTQMTVDNLGAISFTKTLLYNRSN